MKRVDSGDIHAKTDLLRVYAADSVCGTGSALKVLVEHILKRYPVPLKAVGIDVRDVVTNYVHSGLVILEAGNPGK